MIAWEAVKDFWNFLEFFPDEAEAGFDGVHHGGIKGIRDDAPVEAKEAFQAYMTDTETNNPRVIISWTAFDDKLKEYADRFGQNFPVFFFRNKPETEIISQVEGCLKENRPFQVTEGGDVDV